MGTAPGVLPVHPFRDSAGDWAANRKGGKEIAPHLLKGTGCLRLHDAISLCRHTTGDWTMGGTKKSRAVPSMGGESGAHAGGGPRKKNLRLHQSKIDEAREILGTKTETETIETALDLVVFRKELLDGVRAMRGANLLNLFGEGD
jgi:hypothetical protein